MTIDLALDPVTHDLNITNFDLVLIDTAEQLRQKLENKLQFFKGEWFLNTLQGIDLYGTVLVKNPNLKLISVLFKSAILDTPGVKEIVKYTQIFDSKLRKLTVDFVADTIYGEIGTTVAI